MIDINYKNIYNQFIEHYKNVHVNPWHEISEQQLKDLYHSLINKIINKMDIKDNYSFKYFMDYIIKRLNGTQDAHTKYDSVSLIPMNFRTFGNEVLINYPNDLRNGKVLSINGISIDTIMDELEEIITYGMKSKKTLM